MDVCRSLGERVRVVGLAALRSWELLGEQAAEFRPATVAIVDQGAAAALRKRGCGGAAVVSGPQSLVELVSTSGADLVLAAIVGAAGLPATLAAVERGMTVGLANKESLVVAGALLMPIAQRSGATLIPVDSEHSAIFQCLQGNRRADVKRVHLTASGGPFRTWPVERMEQATLADALRHPVWSMGPKITIDSATMMNKALEVVEAHHLFGLKPEQIDVLVHPESIVHSMVEYLDGSTMAQLGVPDMKTPIQYAMTYPARCNGITQPLVWESIRALHFEAPDRARFPAIELGFEAARRGGTAGAVLNGANEAAVERFRAGRLAFGQIARVTGELLGRHAFRAQPTLDELLEADAWARREVEECVAC